MKRDGGGWDKEGCRGRLVGEVRVAVITCTSSVWGCISVSVVVVLVSEQQQHVVEREGAEAACIVPTT